MAMYKVTYSGLDEKCSDRYVARERSSMHFAASRGQLMVLHSLIREKAPVNARTSMGYTPLHDACWTNHPYCANHLIRAGAEINAMSTDGHTPLALASSVGSKDCVKLLLDLGAEVNVEDDSCSSPVHAAAVAGCTECLELLLASDGSLDSTNPYYGTPLHAACGGPSVECASLLISSGADVRSVRRRDLQTPLHVAAEVNSEGLVQLLVCNGADIHARDKQGRKPVDLAPGDSITHGLLLTFMTNPESLTSLCRNQIRASLGRTVRESHIKQLEIPRPLQEYIMYTEKVPSDGGL
ncbi:uncharacterized protein [Diadema antillarum]|uniref:uncharacterized protein n=1 Tax=Diadema antillarum TaxID=105358 RepID=UPI003A8BF82A